MSWASSAAWEETRIGRKTPGPVATAASREISRAKVVGLARLSAGFLLELPENVAVEFGIESAVALRCTSVSPPTSAIERETLLFRQAHIGERLAIAWDRRV